MQKAPFKTYKVYIRLLSPLHVGTGEVYEPTNFFIHAEKKYMGVIEFEKLCSYLTKHEVDKFIELCKDGSLKSIIKLYSLIDDFCLKLLNGNKKDFLIRKIPVSSYFVKHYQKVKDLQYEINQEVIKEFNKFTISRTAFSPNEKHPIIPGSSIKGSIRTAVLNMWKGKAKGRSCKDYFTGKTYDSIQLESEILSYHKTKLNRDPFRFIKLSDFKPLKRAQTKITYAVNIKKDGGKGRGPLQMLEVIEPGAVFEGLISIVDGSKITLKTIQEALKFFYVKETQRENSTLKVLGAEQIQFSPNAFPIRIGRHSGAECVTVEGFRCIRIRQGKRRSVFLDHSTTIWLASDNPRYERFQLKSLQPFGWAELFFTDSLEMQWETLGETEKCKKDTPVDISKLSSKYRVIT